MSSKRAPQVSPPLGASLSGMPGPLAGMPSEASEPTSDNHNLGPKPRFPDAFRQGLSPEIEGSRLSTSFRFSSDKVFTSRRQNSRASAGSSFQSLVDIALSSAAVCRRPPRARYRSARRAASVFRVKYHSLRTGSLFCCWERHSEGHGEGNPCDNSPEPGPWPRRPPWRRMDIYPGARAALRLCDRANIHALAGSDR
jgi:hypothetical protein